jgi:ABC-type methionine transport system permease subunit
MLATVFILVLIVQGLQVVGDRLAGRFLHG